MASVFAHFVKNTTHTNTTSTEANVVYRLTTSLRKARDRSLSMESSNEHEVEVAQASASINLNIDTNIDPDTGKAPLNTPATTTSTSTNFSFGSPAEAENTADHVGSDDFVESILSGAKEPLQIPYISTSSVIDEHEENESNNSNITMAQRSTSMDTSTSASATIERNVHKRKKGLIDKTIQLSILNKFGDEDFKYTHDSKYNKGSGEE
jgi:hypothetical protein